MKNSIKKLAYIDTNYCVACGVCVNTCPVKALSIPTGIYSVVNPEKCVGCGQCAKACPASVIEMIARKEPTNHE